MFGIAVVPSVLMALGMAISPESPRWLFQVLLIKLPSHSCHILKFFDCMFMLCSVHVFSHLLIVSKNAD